MKTRVVPLLLPAVMLMAGCSPQDSQQAEDKTVVEGIETVPPPASNNQVESSADERAANKTEPSTVVTIASQFVERPEFYPVADMSLSGVLTLKNDDCLLIENVGNRNNPITLYPKFDASAVSWNGKELSTKTQKIAVGETFRFSANLAQNSENIQNCGFARRATIQIDN